MEEFYKQDKIKVKMCARIKKKNLVLMQWEGGRAEEKSGGTLKQEVWGFPRRGRSLGSCGTAGSSASSLGPRFKPHMALPPTPPRRTLTEPVLLCRLSL